MCLGHHLSPRWIACLSPVNSLKLSVRSKSSSSCVFFYNLWRLFISECTIVSLATEYPYLADECHISGSLSPEYPNYTPMGGLINTSSPIPCMFLCIWKLLQLRLLWITLLSLVDFYPAPRSGHLKYMEVFFGNVTKITSVLIHHVETSFAHVQQFHLMYSDDGIRWRDSSIVSDHCGFFFVLSLAEMNILVSNCFLTVHPANNLHLTESGFVSGFSSICALCCGWTSRWTCCSEGWILWMLHHCYTWR